MATRDTINTSRNHCCRFLFLSAEQHRIVAKIEELFSELDKGVDSLKTAREQLKVYRQALLKHAFEGKLTAAVAWREKPLGQLLGFLTSGSRGWAAYYASSGDLFVRAQNIKHDCLELDDVAFVSLPDKAEGLRTRVQQGDLLITITGANVTKAALVKDELGTAFVSQHVALCRPTTEILPDYLYWFIVAEAAGRKQLTEMAYGAGKPGLT
jgi:type I restriction enzyme S subunit